MARLSYSLGAFTLILIILERGLLDTNVKVKFILQLWATVLEEGNLLR